MPGEKINPDSKSLPSALRTLGEYELPPDADGHMGEPFGYQDT